MLDSSASSPINLTPFDALLLDADSLMELGSLMQAKAAELATDISKYREGSERSGVAPDGPMGSSLASTNASVQRLQAELDAVIGELNRALTDLHSSKQWESKFEQLRTQHLNTSNELTQALASNKALQARVEALERKSSVAVTSQQAQLQMRVQHLAAASEKSEKQAKQWQSAARSLRSQLEGLKADHDEKLVALQRKHERALLCQMRASVRALKAIQSRQRYSRRSGAESDSNRAQPTTTPTLEEPDLKLPPRSPATPDATKADLQVTVKHDIGSSAGRTAMLDSNNSLPVDP
jgi:chromosome segregation ATPase